MTVNKEEFFHSVYVCFVDMEKSFKLCSLRYSVGDAPQTWNCPILLVALTSRLGCPCNLTQEQNDDNGQMNVLYLTLKFDNVVLFFFRVYQLKPKKIHMSSHVFLKAGDLFTTFTTIVH